MLMWNRSNSLCHWYEFEEAKHKLNQHYVIDENMMEIWVGNAYKIKPYKIWSRKINSK